MFNFGNIDKKTLYIILGIFAIFGIISLGTDGIMSILLTLPGVILAISFHEFAHAYVADKFGDTTPRSQGRLTLDPKAHLDPMGVFLLIFAHIGWGKPVEINPRNFTSNKSRESCEMWVALAGPLTNFLLAIILTIIAYSIEVFIPSIGNVIRIINTVILYSIYVNIGLGVFNLIPMPPLDGEKIFRRFLPYSAVEWLDKNDNILQMVFLLLWVTGILSKVVAPIISVLANWLLNGVGAIFSVFM